MFTPEWLEKVYPIYFKVVKGNPYNLPVGKVLRGRYKEGDASPFPIELYGERLYQMKTDEVVELHSTND